MEADLALTNMAFGTREEERLAVQFFRHPVKDDDRSLAEGRDVYVDSDFIRIIVPGDQSSIVERPVRQGDAERFPRHWQAFKNRMEAPVIGTPLAMWSGVTPAQVLEFAFFNIKTVEQLAEMSDGNAQRFMGANILRQKARDFLALSKDQAPMERMRAELVERDNLIDTQSKQIADLQKAVDELKELVAKKGK